jgi:radical SAM protein with 4Fe4S-binding SPASM domain
MRRLEKQVRVIHRGCRAGRDRLTVNPDGAITPCVCMDVAEARLGNVRTHSLGDVFRESSLCQLLRSPWDHGICTDCPEVTTCGAGCRAAAYGCTGTLNGLDLSCPVRKSRMKAASVKSGGNG